MIPSVMAPGDWRLWLVLFLCLFQLVTPRKVSCHLVICQLLKSIVVYDCYYLWLAQPRLGQRWYFGWSLSVQVFFPFRTIFDCSPFSPFVFPLNFKFSVSTQCVKLFMLPCTSADPTLLFSLTMNATHEAHNTLNPVQLTTTSAEDKYSPGASLLSQCRL